MFGSASLMNSSSIIIFGAISMTTLSVLFARPRPMNVRRGSGQMSLGWSGSIQVRCGCAEVHGVGTSAFILEILNDPSGLLSTTFVCLILSFSAGVIIIFAFS